MDELDQRQPRVRDSAHLGFVAALPCVACLVLSGKFTRPVQVAHLRTGSLEHEKRPTGMAEKPSDKWTLPLCFPHHNGGKGSQHSMGELDFWAGLGINPFDLCLELSAAFTGGKPGLPIIVRAVGGARRARLGE